MAGGIFFDVSASEILPLSYIEIHSVWVRGRAAGCRRTSVTSQPQPEPLCGIRWVYWAVAVSRNAQDELTRGRV